MLKVKEIIPPYVESTTLDATVQEAAMKMKDLNVEAIPIEARHVGP
ncbi:MAG: hypothetical protein ABI980_15660 [Nitrospirota bacterium]|jgi:CBS domain-containing protein